MNLWNIHCGPETDKPSKLLQERAMELKKAVPKDRKAESNRFLIKSLMNMNWAYMKPRVIELLVMA